MGRKRNPGLYKRNGVWHIDKKVNGHRICENTGTSDLAEAEKHLAKKIEDVRQAKVFGVRPQHSLNEAALKYLQEHQYKRSIKVCKPVKNSQVLTFVQQAQPVVEEVPATGLCGDWAASFRKSSANRVGKKQKINITD